MAALQRFKLLSTCTAPPQSPSRSPAPPCFRLHRHRRHVITKKVKNKTLRHVISSPDPDLDTDLDLDRDPGEKEDTKGLLRDKDNSRSLRDLFVSSPKGKGGGDCGAGGASAVGNSGAASGRSGGGWRFIGLRNRLLRRAWRPVLVAIPE